MVLPIARRSSLSGFHRLNSYTRSSTRSLSTLSSRLQQQAASHAEVEPAEQLVPSRGIQSRLRKLRELNEQRKQDQAKGQHLNANPSRPNGVNDAARATQTDQEAVKQQNAVPITIDGTIYQFSPLLLRDMCTCPRCLDPSSKQKEYCTVDIPANVQASSVSVDSAKVAIRWTNDIAGYDGTHVSEYDIATLRNYVQVGTHKVQSELPERILWDANMYTQNAKEIEYNSYMEDEYTLHRALQQLQTYGLLFVVNTPDNAESVNKIVERIGPLKNTFYGWTWDVRSVPQAKNVAYTSKDLGFHMDLLYLNQPPHLQFLHCIRSSSLGGASLFTDSFKAVSDLNNADPIAFEQLKDNDVHFHYDHSTYQYRRCHQVIEMKHPHEKPTNSTNIVDQIEAVAWSPPFQAPFALPPSSNVDDGQAKQARVGDGLAAWHSSASKFNTLIHRPEMIYERMMGPGECVIFDNRRVLHARRAFDVDDVGKERWLRGAYVDKDPYLSKLKVLQKEFGA